MNITDPLSRRRRRSIFSLTNPLIYLPVSGFSITGTITGPLVEGVTIYALNSSTRQVVGSGISDALGEYLIESLPSGDYNIIPVANFHTFTPDLHEVSITSNVVLDFVSVANGQYLYDDTTIAIVDENNIRLWEEKLPYNLFITESQGTIDPMLITNDGSLVSWDWGDNSTDTEINDPVHTYTDSAPTHNVNLYNFEPLSINTMFLEFLSISTVDVSELKNLQKLWIDNNPNLTSVDLSNQTSSVFDHLNISSTGISGVLDLSRFFNLTVLTAGSTNISSVLLPSSSKMFRLRLDYCPNMTDVDVINLPHLIDVHLNNSSFSDSVIDKVLIDLDNHGRVNGYFNFASNAGSPTNLSYAAYQSLLGKGWTLIGTPPSSAGFPYILPITFIS